MTVYAPLPPGMLSLVEQLAGVDFEQVLEGLGGLDLQASAADADLPPAA
jgi:hypothetical protein